MMDVIKALVVLGVMGFLSFFLVVIIVGASQTKKDLEYKKQREEEDKCRKNDTGGD